MATIALTGTFWKAPGDVAWASAPYTIRLVRPFAILGEAAHPRWSRSGTASPEGAISETLTVPDEGTAHFELVAPDGNIYTAHLAADDTPTVEAWMAAAYTTPTDISTTQSLIDAALEDFAVGAAPVDSVFGRIGDVTAQAGDYAAHYAPLAHAALTNNPHSVTAAQVGAATADDIATHAADTTSVHGIADTAALVTTSDARLSDARTPTAHAASHTNGSDQIADVVSGGASGLMSGAQASKLAGVATGATANATDAELRDRATHTGAQAIATVTGLQAALDAKAASDHLHPTLTTITDATTARTLALTDAGKHIDFTSGSPITVTVPANATVAFPVGSVIAGARMGSGTLTIAGAGGVTINSAGGKVAVAEQYGAWAIRKTAMNTWHLIGALG